ncbi:hypothetical protein KTH72_09990, partial [Acinetobacter lwoffii]|nr:hypothetical protein [Acinetobacter lwoffii]
NRAMGGESIKPIRKRIHVYFLMDTYNKESSTGIAIKEFNTRIDYILNLLKQNDPKLYSMAVINYKPNHFFSL